MSKISQGNIKVQKDTHVFTFYRVNYGAPIILKKSSTRLPTLQRIKTNQHKSFEKLWAYKAVWLKIYLNKIWFNSWSNLFTWWGQLCQIPCEKGGRMEIISLHAYLLLFNYGLTYKDQFTPNLTHLVSSNNFFKLYYNLHDMHTQGSRMYGSMKLFSSFLCTTWNICFYILY